jgi:hypothetical protein
MVKFHERKSPLLFEEIFCFLARLLAGETYLGNSPYMDSE